MRTDTIDLYIPLGLTSGNGRVNRQSNGTPTGSTGPTEAFEGSFYIYGETSGNIPNGSNAILLPLTLDFDTAASAENFIQVYPT